MLQAKKAGVICMKYEIMVQRIHSFHIPVMGLAFTIDSPLKVAKYGISSVVSLGDDELIEDMRRHYSNKYGIEYEPIAKFDEDFRARRITAYLNLLDDLVKKQFSELRSATLDAESELTKYLEMLDDTSHLKRLYQTYCSTKLQEEKDSLEKNIRNTIMPGNIDVNIMAKVDPPAHTKAGELLSSEYSGASAALRGYANSRLNSSLILSAGFNPRLYNALASFSDFFPDKEGVIKKQIILKVSDFRSAKIQGMYLAKKGIFVSEFRIESGLNCGGHAFPTEGYLLGPILQEFKLKKEILKEELLGQCIKVWKEKQIIYAEANIEMRVSVQGGIGTANENKFLLDYYDVNATGWGTPFLLVPEATTVDTETLKNLANAKAEQLFLSEASPLGVPFNNFSISASEILRKNRIKECRPGSPCLKKYLVSNTEFTTEPICTASRQYIYHKLKQLDDLQLPKAEYDAANASIIAKECLCEDLAAPAYINTGTKAKLKPSTAVCPGPNLAFFSGTFTLKQMVDHIYGRVSLLNANYRPNMFVNELKLYIEYLEKEVKKQVGIRASKQINYLSDFINNLKEGIKYYKDLIPNIKVESASYLKRMREDIANLEKTLLNINLTGMATN